MYCSDLRNDPLLTYLAPLDPPTTKALPLPFRFGPVSRFPSLLTSVENLTRRNSGGFIVQFILEAFRVTLLKVVDDSYTAAILL